MESSKKNDGWEDLQQVFQLKRLEQQQQEQPQQPIPTEPSRTQVLPCQAAETNIAIANATMTTTMVEITDTSASDSATAVAATSSTISVTQQQQKQRRGLGTKKIPCVAPQRSPRPDGGNGATVVETRESLKQAVETVSLKPPPPIPSSVHRASNKKSSARHAHGVGQVAVQAHDIATISKQDHASTTKQPTENSSMEVARQSIEATACNNHESAVVLGATAATLNASNQDGAAVDTADTSNWNGTVTATSSRCVHQQNKKDNVNMNSATTTPSRMLKAPPRSVPKEDTSTDATAAITTSPNATALMMVGKSSSGSNTRSKAARKSLSKTADVTKSGKAKEMSNNAPAFVAQNHSSVAKSSSSNRRKAIDTNSAVAEAESTADTITTATTEAPVVSSKRRPAAPRSQTGRGRASRSRSRGRLRVPVSFTSTQNAADASVESIEQLRQESPQLTLPPRPLDANQEDTADLSRGDTVTVALGLPPQQPQPLPGDETAAAAKSTTSSSTVVHTQKEMVFVKPTDDSNRVAVAPVELENCTSIASEAASTSAAAHAGTTTTRQAKTRRTKRSHSPATTTVPAKGGNDQMLNHGVSASPDNNDVLHHLSTVNSIDNSAIIDASKAATVAPVIDLTEALAVAALPAPTSKRRKTKASCESKATVAAAVTAQTTEPGAVSSFANLQSPTATALAGARTSIAKNTGSEAASGEKGRKRQGVRTSSSRSENDIDIESTNASFSLLLPRNVDSSGNKAAMGPTNTETPSPPPPDRGSVDNEIETSLLGKGASTKTDKALLSNPSNALSVTTPTQQLQSNRAAIPSSHTSATGKTIVVSGNRTRYVALWPGNQEYEAFVASHCSGFHLLNRDQVESVYSDMLSRFHFQYFKSEQWYPLKLTSVRKKFQTDFLSPIETTASGDPIISSLTRDEAVPARSSGSQATLPETNGQASDPSIQTHGRNSITNQSSPVLQPGSSSRNDGIAGGDDEKEYEVSRKRKRTDKAVDAPATDTGETRCTPYLQKAANQAASIGKQVVFCSRSDTREQPGNVAYRLTVLEEQVRYLASSDAIKTDIVGTIMQRFEFKRPNGDGHWELAEEQWVISKVKKAFKEMRRRSPLPKARQQKKQLVACVESEHLHRFADGSPYIEELAYHHFVGLDPAKRVVEPLPLPGPRPDAPQDNSVTWTYDETSRVYLGDFSGVPFVPNAHKRFLGELMERDDITVICEGLLGELIDKKSFLEIVRRSFGSDPHHKFRRFERREEGDAVSYHEIDGHVSIKVADYIAYIEMLDGDLESVPSFIITDHKGKQETITAQEAHRYALYMIDVDMPKNLVRINEEYKKNFKMQEILPGGAWCMLNPLPEQSRPFMGPNCYICPGGGFTQVHQDGHGTVDSGHSCIAGLNEVVMLRRLPEDHKRNACRMVPTFKECRKDDKAQNMLYRLPHDDGREDKPTWPTDAIIESWQGMGYCPSVFILKPGQHALIGKGRLHTFRKLTIDELPDTDCHALLRREIVKTMGLTQSPLCISIAFDWMFTGITAEGINRENAAALECTALCRDNKCKSLAIPETSILRLASQVPSPPHTAAAIVEHEPLEQAGCVFRRRETMDVEFRPPWKEIARGILPSLRHVVHREAKLVNGDVTKEYCRQGTRTKRVPDSAVDATRAAIDPFGNDYFCKLCDYELSNNYYHCEGCESLLSKDFNICSLCFEEKKFLENKLMHDGPQQDMHTNRHHVGQPSRAACDCEVVMAECDTCQLCMTCANCTCHTYFSKRSRFYSHRDMKRMLGQVEALVGSGRDDEVEFARETQYRLERVVMVPKQSHSQHGYDVAAAHGVASIPVAVDDEDEDLFPEANASATTSPRRKVTSSLLDNDEEMDSKPSAVERTPSSPHARAGRASRNVTRVQRYGHFVNMCDDSDGDSFSAPGSTNAVAWHCEDDESLSDEYDNGDGDDDEMYHDKPPRLEPRVAKKVTASRVAVTNCTASKASASNDSSANAPATMCAVSRPWKQNATGSLSNSSTRPSCILDVAVPGMAASTTLGGATVHNGTHGRAAATAALNYPSVTVAPADWNATNLVPSLSFKSET